MQNLGHDLRRGLNNFNPLGNNYKSINKWLAEMKNIDSSLKTLDKEISADAKLIATWGANEGDDLADVSQRMSQLMEEVGLIQQAYSLRHTAYRKTIKSLKTQEMTLDENRKRKQDLTSQIAKAQKASKENPIKLMELQAAYDRVSAELLTQELELLQFKRVTVKEAFDAKFDAMLEYAEKMALIAGYGRAITLVIDTEPQVADRMRVYNGGEYTAGAVNQVKAAVTNWQPQPVNAPVNVPVNVPVEAPVRPHIVHTLSQDELALSAAAAACNSKTPPLSHTTYAANDGYTSGQEHATEMARGNSQEQESSPRSSHADQVSRIQEEQLKLEQRRLHQQNLASYSPVQSPAQQHYQDAAGNSSNNGTYSISPQRGTQELYPPALPVYEPNSNASPGQGYNNIHTQSQYGQYDTSTYQSTAPPRNYHLGFVDPRERGRMENSRYRMSVAQVLATFLPYLLSAPLLPLAILAVAVLTLSTLAAADTTVQERQQQRQKEESGEAVTLTKAHALGFGFVASVGLLAMWMWSNVLVYLSLLTFGLGSFVSIQQCMPGIMKRLGLEQGQQWHYNTIAGLLVMSWFWYRNSSHSWIFQDILGGFTITLMLKVLKAPSMSSPTLLLLTAFVYDVFFVFVTPYLTKSGESIMEAAATGAAMTVKENIPMLFRIPSFSPNGGEAILGFGDVVLPGILVTFLKECDARLEEDQNPAGLVSLIGIDLPKTIILQAPPCQTKKFWWRKRWSYHLTAILGYAAGLEVTFIAMMWSNKGQPALLYLVPCTIIPVVILASKRHELSLLWHGWGELESEALLVDVDKDDDDNEQRDKDGKLLESIERKPKPVTLDL